MAGQDEIAGSRRLLGSEYPNDDGAAPASLTAALADHASDPARYPEALAALQVARLLVPVVAVLGEVGHDAQGLALDKSSDMAAVLLTGADGRLALLAFTGTEALAAWDPTARPVPVPTRLAAQSALQEGAAALLIDIAGPNTVVVEGEDLHGLAAGWTLARVGEQAAWIRPATE
ncbi:SseB family protein [Nocardioides sp.]|uniref:SseB family protein n=1 Tax=Nocardioides sp. TaxID=35761 RepID=UPI0031FEC56D|nr:hypothetical protein [Nocardioides sp.]